MVAETIGKALAKVPAGGMVAVAAAGSGTVAVAFAGPAVAVITGVAIVGVGAAVGLYVLFGRNGDAGLRV
jgi:hypothetical protein